MHMFFDDIHVIEGLNHFPNPSARATSELLPPFFLLRSRWPVCSPRSQILTAFEFPLRRLSLICAIDDSQCSNESSDKGD